VHTASCAVSCCSCQSFRRSKALHSATLLCDMPSVSSSTLASKSCDCKVMSAGQSWMPPSACNLAACSACMISISARCVRRSSLASFFSTSRLRSQLGFFGATFTKMLCEAVEGSVEANSRQTGKSNSNSRPCRVLASHKMRAARASVAASSARGCCSLTGMVQTCYPARWRAAGLGLDNDCGWTRRAYV